MNVADILSSGMPTRKLGAMASRVQDVGHAGEEPLSVFLERGVVRRSDTEGNHNVLGADLAKYQLVQPGDLVFNRLRTWQGGFGASGYRGIVSPAYIVLRPRDADARFLQYVLLSRPYLAELTRLSKWMPPSQFDILWADLKTIELPCRTLTEQRRIADFLDDRVARIDQIIAARRLQRALAFEALRAELETRLWPQRESVPLKTLVADVTSGPRGWGDLVCEEGAEFVRITNLRPLGIELDRTNLLHVAPPPGAEATRSRLETGDVLLSITAVFGEVSVWRGGTGAFSQHVARIRPLNRRDSDWIAWVLQCHSLHDQYALSGYGGTKAGMGLEQVRSLAVPRVAAEERRRVGESLNALWATYQTGLDGLNGSMAALAEYKQSLITAAVTGEFDVTTASTKIPREQA